jgi:hypothetical protein
LLELIAASAVTVVLMAAALAVIGLLSRDRIRARGGADTAGKGLPRSVPQVLMWDLLNARRAYGSADGHSLVLIGYGMATPASAAAPGRAVEVRYELRDERDSDGHKRNGPLVRRQRYLDAAEGDGNAWSAELVAFDVARLWIGGEPDAAVKAQAPAATPPGPQERGRLGRSVLVKIEWQDGSTTEQRLRRN